MERMDEVKIAEVIERARRLGAQDQLDMNAAADELLTMTTDRDTLSAAMGQLMREHTSRGGPYLLQAWLIVQRALKRRVP